MKRHEKGQGLVEYALILVLVAIVVIAVMLLVGPAVGDSFCELMFVLNDQGPSGEFDTTHVVSMDPIEGSVTFDVVVTSPGSCSSNMVVDDVVDDPSHGLVENPSGGTFTYWPTEVSSGTDDSFTFSWHFSDSYGPYFSLVTIIVGEPDLLASEANIMSNAEQPARGKKPARELDDVDENILALFEAAEEQEESLQEGVDLTLEAIVEGLEVLMDFTDDNDNQPLSESLSQLLQEVKDGNLVALPEVITEIGTDLAEALAEAPLEVQISILRKMGPRLIDSCVMFSNGSVSPDTIAAAQQALEGLDENHPGKADALDILEGAVVIIEKRNDAIEDYTEYQSAILEIFITGLELAGEEELAQQLAADSEACGN